MPGYLDLPRAKRRRLALLLVIRPTLTATCLVAAYFLLPMDTRLVGESLFWLVTGLIGVAALVVHETRAITRSEYPRLRAVQLIVTSLPLFLLLFASAYFLMDRATANTFTQAMTRTDALYFTLTVFTTVGFGDIAPRSEAARIVTMVQMLGNLILIGVAARVVVGAVQVGIQRRTAAGSAGNPAEPGGGTPAGPPE